MIERVRTSDAPRYLLLTECSMGDNIVAENPDKEMVRLCSIRCPHMNEITLEDTLDALRFDRYPIEVPCLCPPLPTPMATVQWRLLSV